MKYKVTLEVEDGEADEIASQSPSKDIKKDIQAFWINDACEGYDISVLKVEVEILNG